MAKGDHLSVCLGQYAGLISHHGIDMGDGSVVHFYKRNLGEAPVIDRTSWKEFTKGGVGNIDVIRHGQSMHPNDVVKAAELCLQYSGDLPYELFDANCEHIATWCKTGRFYSKQAARTEEGKDWLGLAAEIGLGFL